MPHLLLPFYFTLKSYSYIHDRIGENSLENTEIHVIFTNFLQMWDEETLIQLANIAGVGYHKGGNKVSASTVTSYHINRCKVRVSGTC